MNDLDYVKNFSKIHVTKICKKLKVDRANLLNGKTKEENAKRVRSEIESEVAKLYIINEEGQKENNEQKENN